MNKHPRPLPIVMSADTGRDDAWTIFGMVRNRMDLIGVIASYGNVARAKVVRNTLDVLSLAQGSAIVWAGPDKTSSTQTAALAEIDARDQKYLNGLCGLDLTQSRQPVVQTDDWAESAAQFLRSNGPVTFINTGPLTALARLVDIMSKSDLDSSIDRVICMGGSFDRSLAADFNILADPGAANRVLTAFGERLVLVPFDETRHLHLSLQAIERLQGADAMSMFSRDLMIAQARRWPANGGLMLHDPATLLLIDDADIVDVSTQPVRIVETGPDIGKAIQPADAGVVQIAKFPDADRARERILTKYLGLKPS